jgi:hypothetical protein
MDYIEVILRRVPEAAVETTINFRKTCLQAEI